jgi:alkylation response protein AidB-like acyl-CoA dehydrogenase
MIDRRLFSAEHEIFRAQVARFMEREVVPFHDQWEKDGQISRETWNKAGEMGLLCPTVPEAYGGAGADFLYSTIVLEELARVGATGPGFGLHSDIVAPYILHYGSEAQKQAWLPKMVSGEVVGAIAMTEPGAGSDLQGVRTSDVGRRPFRMGTALSSTAQRPSSQTVSVPISSCW